MYEVPKISQYFRTRSPVNMVDIDGWHASDLINPLFFNDNSTQQLVSTNLLIISMSFDIKNWDSFPRLSYTSSKLKVNRELHAETETQIAFRTRPS